MVLLFPICHFPQLSSPLMPESIISARGLNRATLARQMLLARERVKPVPAIERLAGMQAQWPRPPFVGLWTRLEGFTRDDLLKAIERRISGHEILKAQ